MNKLIQYIAILCIVMSMSSCRFSEECNYTGNVELIMDCGGIFSNRIH